MPIEMSAIYRLLFFCLFICRILVTDISGMGGHRVVKLCWMVDLGSPPGLRCIPRPVATGRVICICDWLIDATGLDFGDRS